jgi:hypothetical protein
MASYLVKALAFRLNFQCVSDLTMSCVALAVTKLKSLRSQKAWQSRGFSSNQLFSNLATLFSDLRSGKATMQDLPSIQVNTLPMLHIVNN